MYLGGEVNEPMLKAKLGGVFPRRGLNVPCTVGKAVGRSKALVRLDTFYADTSLGVPARQTLQKPAERQVDCSG